MGKPSGSVAAIPTRGKCRPWCVNHDGENDICRGVDEPTPASEFNPADTVSLYHTPEEGDVIYIGSMYLPLSVAKGVALALARQIDRARGAEPIAVGGAL